MRRAGGIVFAFAFAFGIGCRTPTQITVEVSTDFPCTQAKDTTITVAHVGALELEQAKPITVTASCTNGRVGSLVVVPSGSRTDEVAIRVVTGIDQLAEKCVYPDYSGCIVARRAVHFLPHDELALPIIMRRSCLDHPCNPEQSCVAGACVSSTIVDSHACEGSGCDETVLAPGTDAGPLADASEAGADADATVDADAGTDARVDSTTDAPTDVGDAGPPDPLLAGALAGALWPMRHGSPTHVARTTFRAPTSNAPGLRLSPPKSATAIPVVGPDGVIYYGDDLGYVAFDPAKGLPPLWTLPVGSAAPPTTDAALASDGYLYVCVGTGLWKIDRKSGAKVGDVTVGGCGDVTLGPGPVAYVAGDGAISAVDLAAGSLLWTKTLVGVASGMTLAPNGKLYVGGSDRVYEIDAKSGATLRPFPVLDGGVAADPIAGDDGAIFVATSFPGGTIYAFELSTTAERWHYKVDSRVNFAFARGLDGTIYAGAGVVYAFNPTTGGLLWKTNSSGASYVSGTLLVDRASVVIAGAEGDGKLVAFDGANLGKELWSHPLVGSPIGVVPGGDGILYLRTDTVLDAIGP